MLVLVLLCTLSLWAQDGFRDVEKRVVEHTLKNGLKFIILERHEAPVVSFHTYVNVGSVNESRGLTGLAHMFEHIAFKGTPQIGTNNYKKEQAALDKVDKVFAMYFAERIKSDRADSAKLKQLKADFDSAQAEAGRYVVTDQFSTIIQEAGGVGLNASTNMDATQYFYSFPSNKLELWMSLESDRFLQPVMREFYKERDVVMEERRLRTESQPIGKLIEEVLAVAYKAHPYGVNVIGHMSDLQALTRSEAEKFYRTYYAPGNITIAIVGDVDAKEVIRLAENYFGRLSAGPQPPPVTTIEPPQLGERRVAIEEQSQRVLLVGYHRGSILHKDDAVFDAIGDILSSGRTSRLYRSLVRDKKVATVAGGLSGFPGNKYPNLFLFFSFPAPGHTNEECEKAIEEEITKLKTDLVDDEMLNAVKTRARAGLIRSLNSNGGMAGQLTFYQAVTGNWHNLFRQLDEINAVTAQDIKRVANECFTKSNRTVGMIEPAKQ
jgi:predicted Zn-dependent peptidase